MVFAQRVNHLKHVKPHSQQLSTLSTLWLKKSPVVSHCSNVWDRLSLHVPIWIAFATFGYQFGGGGAPVVEEEVVAVVKEVDIEWQKCGQYGLIYWEPEEVPGFYDCRKPT